MKKKRTNDINGWLNLYKPKGISSAQAVAKIKRLYNAKKAGHAGTLDPLAEGILPIAFGKATKTVSLFMDAKKTYVFELTFGKQTTTDDAQGSIIRESSKLPNQEELQKLLPSFTGTIEQVPPQFSAIKQGGVRAYKQARAGISIELPKRTITIDSLDVLSFTETQATFRAKVSKGTYIRSLGRDIGQKLGCYAFVSYLERTAVGPFIKESAISFEDLQELKDDDPIKFEELLIPTENVLRQLSLKPAEKNSIENMF